VREWVNCHRLTASVCGCDDSFGVETLRAKDLRDKSGEGGCATFQEWYQSDQLGKERFSLPRTGGFARLSKEKYYLLPESQICESRFSRAAHILDALHLKERLSHGGREHAGNWDLGHL
jgi:hypothetical protein